MNELLAQLDTPEGRRNPYPLYHALRDSSPLHDERHQATLVLRYEDCARSLSGKEFSRPDAVWLRRRIPDWHDHPAVVCLMRTMQFGDHVSHPRLRGLVSRFFTQRRIAAHVEATAATVGVLVGELAAEIEATGQADLQETLSYRLPSISIARLIGLDEEEVARFRAQSLALAVLLEPQLPGDHLAEADRGYLQLEAFFEEVVDNLRHAPDDSLASYLVQTQHDDPSMLSGDELKSMFTSLFVAGTMNTSSFIGNGVAALLDCPHVMARLRADPGLVEGLTSEILRYDAPMQVTRRITAEEVELGGVVLPAGTELGVVLGSANRDPAVYDDPDSFVLGRTGPPPLSFGGGPFFCIGAAMARQEGELVFAELLSRLPGLCGAGEPDHNLQSVLRGYLRLPVTTSRPALS
ncbi:cytochrome P450 [Lentzea sp. BCCO 10_0061]|uniref:Cytochrome P450 n=1 Tax=Lentzea sokolovensis TaxID=3095429 RepID=A0ABU4VE83_9PSEU|nr:cytochrome P450 [Lentzea sp. BCCO 10_0061]MDX8149494.1 cytochrome P450 [Lentzea sp. BCCO 10_0061]